jgi:hypothetical protein
LVLIGSWADSNCTDPSRIIFLVPDSEWIAVGGEWILVGCPSGFFLDAGPQCTRCPAGFYCSGSRYPPSPCGIGRFAFSGASALSDCISSVPVIVSVNIDILRFEFNDKTAYDMKCALAFVANKSHEHIIIKTAEQSNTGKSTIVVSSISTENEVDADYVAHKLDTESVHTSLVSHGLNGSSLLSVQLGACLPGYELDTSQKCNPCLEKYFCVGGTNIRAACPAGSYSLAKANSSMSCFQVVFVVLSYLIPLSKEKYTDNVEAKFRISVAKAALVPAERVVVTTTKMQGKRTELISITLDVEIATDNAQSAATVVQHLESSALNTQLTMQGLPLGTLISISVTESVPSSDRNNSVLWIIVGVLLGSMILTLGIVFRAMRLKGSVQERSLQKNVTDLLHRLQITRQNGFILSSESVPFWRSANDFIVVQKSHAEAAARLSLLMEFDVNQFDAFCLCLEGELGGYSTSVKNLGNNRTQQYDLLCEWILEIATYLIRPEVVEDAPELFHTTPTTEVRSNLRVEQRFSFLVQKVLKARVWEDLEYALFRRLQVYWQTLLSNIRSNGSFLQNSTKFCAGRCCTFYGRHRPSLR